MRPSTGTMSYHVSVALLGVVAFALTLLVNGAIPGLMAPTTGQAIWTLGFAQSFANGSSIFATNFGYPEPAAMAFGLMGALPAAVFLKIGLPPADAYSLTFALWLAVAFYGTYRFVQMLGGKPGASLVLTLLWSSLPVIWLHASYSMVSLGMVLLPFYFLATLQFLNESHRWPRAIMLAAACIISVFMDGYTFMMFAVGSGVIIGLAFIQGPDRRRLLRCLPIFACAFGIAYLLYASYMGRTKFAGTYLEIFRAYGANIEFLLIPTRRISFFADLIGLSTSRDSSNYFGDASVFRTSFSLPLIVAAIYALVATRLRSNPMLVFLAVALVGFYLCLGPSFKLNVLRLDPIRPDLMAAEFAPWPTGTAWLTFLPGFDSMRASYRWVALGLFGAWVMLATHVASRRAQSGITLLIVGMILVFNVPAPGIIASYLNSRQMIRDIDAYVESQRPMFRDGEVVAFAPYNNDFFVNYMASRLNLRSYNIGGDKNLEAARASWPATMLALEFDQAGEDFEKKVIALLQSRDADVVVIPYMSLLWAAHTWPAPREKYEAMIPYVERLKASQIVDVVETTNFAYVRLKGLTQSSAQ